MHFQVQPSYTILNSGVWQLQQKRKLTHSTERQAVHVRWPKKISNANLYRKTKVEPWSKTIKRRRLNWLGHLMRMQTDTPARIALKEALQPKTKKRGKSQTTWLKTIEKDLAHTIEVDIYHCSAEEITSRFESVTLDRNTWKSTVKNIMESNF